MNTLYNQVSEGLLEQLREGTLKVGDKLPPEAEYAATLGVSRSTLRLAFAELEQLGVILRKKRAGTLIISNKPKKRFTMATTGIDDLLILGRDTDLSITGIRTVRTEDIPQLNGFTSETGHWLEVQGTRTMAGEESPFSINRVYVPARYAGVEPLLKDKETSVFRAIEDAFDVSVGRVSQAVRAIACPAEEAKVMGLPESAPVLQIDAQLYLRDKTLMEISVAVFDPARFQVRSEVEIGSV